MNTNARFAISDILQTINTLNSLGEQTKKDIQQGPGLSLDNEEQLLLKGAFTLMRRTLDALTPLVWNDTRHPTGTEPKTDKKPVLHLV